MKYFIFADPHGNFDALKKALKKAGYNKYNKNHILVGAGDYFDRGEQNLLMLEFLYTQWKKDRAILIRGNHDDFLLEFLQNKSSGIFNATYNGMDKTILDLANWPWLPFLNNFDQIRDEINKKHPYLIEFLESMVDNVLIDSQYNITHAGYKEELEGDWTIDNFAFTPKFVGNYPHLNKTQIFGHWHAFDLHRLFCEGSGEVSPEIFKYEKFIGLDACTTLTNKVNVLKIKARSHQINV